MIRMGKIKSISSGKQVKALSPAYREVVITYSIPGPTIILVVTNATITTREDRPAMQMVIKEPIVIQEPRRKVMRHAFGLLGLTRNLQGKTDDADLVAQELRQNSQWIVSEGQRLPFIDLGEITPKALSTEPAR
jgi:hypothetical protein